MTRNALWLCVLAVTTGAEPAGQGEDPAFDGGTAPSASAEETSCSADVEVRDARLGGVLWVLLFSEAQARAYPTQRHQALRRTDLTPADAGSTWVSFEGLPCGHFAVAVVHDENANGKLDTKIFGIPREGLGASRDARRLFGPPTFDDAKLFLTPGRTPIPIHLKY